jgi:cation:H+ antiporter
MLRSARHGLPRRCVTEHQMTSLLLGGFLFLIGIILVLWGAERFTDGAVRGAALLAVSPFFVGTVVSGLEPENLVTGLAAGLAGLHQVALGTVIGAAIFMLTAGLGLALLLVPMDVTIPRAGAAAMAVVLIPFTVALGTDGIVSRLEGAILAVVAVVLLVWLYRRSPIFLRPSEDEDGPISGKRTALLLVAGLVAMIVGGTLVVEGAGRLIGSLGISETVFGMTVVAIGESVEETARMVAPARRGHPELAWGNVVGTVVILLAANLGVIALVTPLRVDPLVLHVHVPYLIGCTVLVAIALATARRLGRGMGASLVALYVVYLALNLKYVKAE